jgi:glycosyltransferase involved in cell wall biosynthesis
MSPLVSVVLPTYHRPRLLARALASVLDQRHVDLEVLVVDGGTDEATDRLLTSWPDPRIRRFRSEGRGPSAARNTGILAATGDLVAFLDDDDQWLPAKLSRQIALLEAEGPGTGLVGCDVRWEGGGRRIGRCALPHCTPDPRRALLRQTDIALTTLVVRRRLLDRVGVLDPSLGGLAGLDLVLRIARAASVTTVDEALVIRRRAPGAVQAATPEQAAAMERFIAAQPELQANRELRSEWLLRLALLYGELGDRRRRADVVRSAVRTDPANVRALVAWRGRSTPSPPSGSVAGRR